MVSWRTCNVCAYSIVNAYMEKFCNYHGKDIPPEICSEYVPYASHQPNVSCEQCFFRRPCIDQHGDHPVGRCKFFSKETPPKPVSSASRWRKINHGNVRDVSKL